MGNTTSYNETRKMSHDVVRQQIAEALTHKVPKNRNVNLDDTIVDTLSWNDTINYPQFVKTQRQSINDMFNLNTLSESSFDENNEFSVTENEYINKPRTPKRQQKTYGDSYGDQDELPMEQQNGMRNEEDELLDEEDELPDDDVPTGTLPEDVMPEAIEDEDDMPVEGNLNYATNYSNVAPLNYQAMVARPTHALTNHHMPVQANTRPMSKTIQNIINRASAPSTQAKKNIGMYQENSDSSMSYLDDVVKFLEPKKYVQMKGGKPATNNSVQQNKCAPKNTKPKNTEYKFSQSAGKATKSSVDKAVDSIDSNVSELDKLREFIKSNVEYKQQGGNYKVSSGRRQIGGNNNFFESSQSSATSTSTSSASYNRNFFSESTESQIFKGYRIK